MSQRSNILKIYALASEADRSEGLEAYRNYNRTLQGISTFTGLSIHQVAGAFAALSPNTDFVGNLRSTFTLCIGFANGFKAGQCTVSTYNHNREKAWRILEGEHFYSVFQGLKVRNFFRNLTEPEHPEAVTIDGHMANIAAGLVRTMSNSGISKSKYRKLAGLFRSISAQELIYPSQLQAILWFTWKRIHIIKTPVATDQECFQITKNNQWGNYVPIQAIRPFPLLADPKDFTKLNPWTIKK